MASASRYRRQAARWWRSPFWGLLVEARERGRGQDADPLPPERVHKFECPAVSRRTMAGLFLQGFPKPGRRRLMDTGTHISWRTKRFGRHGAGQRQGRAGNRRRRHAESRAPHGAKHQREQYCDWPMGGGLRVFELPAVDLLEPLVGDDCAFELAGEVGRNVRLLLTEYGFRRTLGLCLRQS